MFENILDWIRDLPGGSLWVWGSIVVMSFIAYVGFKRA